MGVRLRTAADGKMLKDAGWLSDKIFTIGIADGTL